MQMKCDDGCLQLAQMLGWAVSIITVPLPSRLTLEIERCFVPPVYHLCSTYRGLWGGRGCSLVLPTKILGIRLGGAGGCPVVVAQWQSTGSSR